MPTETNDNEKNALYQAIRNNNIEEVKSLYDSHPDWIPQYQEGSNESPMPVGFREIFRHGTFSQNLEMVQYIIEKMGPNLVTAVTTNGQTALHLSKNVEVMKLIINKIATLGGNVEEYVNKIDRFGKTALYDATETEEVEILRKNGANPFIGKSPLLYDSSPQRTKGALNGMFSYLSIEDQTRLANKDRPILHTQRMDVLKCLIKKGAKIETAEEFTSIIENSRTEHSALNMTKFLLPLASKLLENKPEDIKNIHDYILLKYTNNPEVSRILFNSFNKYNLDINAPEINGNPPPHLAREDNIKTALIDREADIFAENNEGLRPTPPEHLYFDPSSQRISDRNQNNYGKLPINYAESRELKEFLTRRGGNSPHQNLPMEVAQNGPLQLFPGAVFESKEGYPEMGPIPMEVVQNQPAAPGAVFESKEGYPEMGPIPMEVDSKEGKIDDIDKKRKAISPASDVTEHTPYTTELTEEVKNSAKEIKISPSLENDITECLRPRKPYNPLNKSRRYEATVFPGPGRGPR